MREWTLHNKERSPSANDNFIVLRHQQKVSYPFRLDSLACHFWWLQQTHMTVNIHSGKLYNQRQPYVLFTTLYFSMDSRTGSFRFFKLRWALLR